MSDPRKTVERHEVEAGYFREMIGDLAAKNEELEADNERLTAALAQCSQARAGVADWVVNLYPHLEDGINEILKGENCE